MWLLPLHVATGLVLHHKGQPSADALRADAPLDAAVVLRYEGIAYGSGGADKTLALPDLGVDHSLGLSNGSARVNSCIEGVRSINPSFYIPPNRSGAEAWTFFRLLCMSRGLGGHHWSNSFGFGVAAIDEDFNWRWHTYSPLPDPRFLAPNASRLQECLVPVTPERDYAEGPEDPKVFSFRGKQYVIFSATELFPSQSGTKRPPCVEHGWIQQVAEVLSVSPVSLGQPTKMLFKNMHFTEKNWSPFSWRSPPHLKHGGRQEREASAEEEDLFVVYSIEPHVISKINITTGEVHQAFSTSSHVLEKLAARFRMKPDQLHGGAGVVRVESSKGAYYLSILHGVESEHHPTLPWLPQYKHRYINWPYKFSAEPPFEVLQVGKALPLHYRENPMNGAIVQYVSSVALSGDTVLIGYNIGDTDSRVYAIPLRDFEQEFFGTPDVLPPPLLPESPDLALGRFAIGTPMYVPRMLDRDWIWPMMKEPFTCPTKQDVLEYGEFLLDWARLRQKITTGFENKPNPKAWCMLPGEAQSMVELCLWKQDPVAAAAKEYNLALGVDRDDLDATYCFAAGFCNTSVVSANTTVNEVEDLCDGDPALDGWRFLGFQDVPAGYQLGGRSTFTSLTETRPFTQLSCALGSFHCEVMYCKEVYCKKDYYLNTHGHLLHTWNKAP